MTLDASGSILVGDSGAGDFRRERGDGQPHRRIQRPTTAAAHCSRCPQASSSIRAIALFVSSSPRVPEVESIDPLTGNRTIYPTPPTGAAGRSSGSPIRFGPSARRAARGGPGEPVAEDPAWRGPHRPRRPGTGPSSWAPARGTRPLFTFPTSIATVPTPAPAPIPEPSSLALLLIGGLGLAGWRRWKGKRAGDTA